MIFIALVFNPRVFTRVFFRHLSPSIHPIHRTNIVMTYTVRHGRKGVVYHPPRVHTTLIPTYIADMSSVTVGGGGSVCYRLNLIPVWGEIM